MYAHLHVFGGERRYSSLDASRGHDLFELLTRKASNHGRSAQGDLLTFVQRESNLHLQLWPQRQEAAVGRVLQALLVFEDTLIDQDA